MKNKGKTPFFIEEKHYSLDKIKENFDDSFIDLLKRKKICVEIPNSSNLKFKFVGLLIFHEKVFLILPKYIMENFEENIGKKMKTVLRVIRKYNKQFSSTFDSIDFTHNNFLNEVYSKNFSLAGFILEDYLNHGLYSKTVNMFEINGSGEINWDYTINDTNPFFNQGAPYYLDCVTNNEFLDENNIVMKVHQWAVAHYSTLFGDWLGFEKIHIYLQDSKLESLGTKEYLIAKLKNELNETFIDRKINLIKALILIIQNELDLSSKQLNIYGVRNYELVWEEVCRFIFDDELDDYIEMIPAPLWTNSDSQLTVEKETFIPDIIKTYNVNDEEYFAVLDAKYYNFRFSSKNVFGNPSVNDVAKQLLYQKAFSRSIQKKIRNYFLFPQDKDSEELIDVIGNVSLDFIDPNPVILVYLSVDKVYNMYLNNVILKAEEYKELEVQTTRRIYSDNN